MWFCFVFVHFKVNPYSTITVGISSSGRCASFYNTLKSEFLVHGFQVHSIFTSAMVLTELELTSCTASERHID